MSDTILVAAVQMQSGSDAEVNWATACGLVEAAAARGARLVALPENVLFEGPPGEPVVHDVDGEWVPRFSELARTHKVALIAGSLREPCADGVPEDQRPFNTSIAFAPDGKEVARYRKIHLFDVDVPGGPKEQESARVRSGSAEPVVAELPPVGKVGLSVCYDLRFPELYRALVALGARVLMVPASFALGTGRDHWLTLLRARAIENLAFVVAPAQHGPTPDGRPKFGRAAVIDPWGTVLAVAADGSDGLALAEIDLGRQERLRRSLPCLEHARMGPLAT